MTDKDKDVELNQDGLPADDEFLEDEEQEQDEEPQDENEEFEESDDTSEAGLAAGAATGRSRFGRGRDRAAGAHEKLGSVRESHERVHINDRASVIYAAAAAIVMLFVVFGAWGAQYLPRNVGPTLTPLFVPTAKVTVAPSGSPDVSLSPAPTASPTAAPTPTPAPSAS